MNQSRSYYLTLVVTLSALNLPATVAHADDFSDSVYSWGSWELDIEPAAGGPIPAANRPIRVKLQNMQFRPNDNNRFTSPSDMMVAGDNPVPPPIPPTAPPVTTGTPGAPPGTGDVRPGMAPGVTTGTPGAPPGQGDVRARGAR